MPLGLNNDASYVAILSTDILALLLSNDLLTKLLLLTYTCFGTLKQLGTGIQGHEIEEV